MKKLLIVLSTIVAVTLLVSCNKEQPVKSTTYTVKMNMPSATTDNVVKYDLTAFEYNEEGEKMANYSISPALYGTSQTFKANSRSVKVKIYVKMYAENSGVAPQYRWVQQVFYLTQGGNIDIVIEEHTTVGPSEP